MGRRLKVPDSRPHRAAARRALGPLHKLQIKPATYARYTRAAAAFLRWAGQQNLEPAADDAEKSKTSWRKPSTWGS